jgi:hypothetical protein
VVRLLPEALEINDELAERDPVLAQLAAAAVSGLPVPSGPRAYPPCPCPTRLRRARRRGAQTFSRTTTSLSIWRRGWRLAELTARRPGGMA